MIGDFAGMLLALYLVQIAMQVDLPQAVVSQMMTNVVLDFLVNQWMNMWCHHSFMLISKY